MSYYCVRIFSGFLLHFFRLNTTPHWIFWGNSRNLFLPCAKLAFISINFGFLFLCVCMWFLRFLCGWYLTPPHSVQVWSLTQFYSVDFSQSRIDVKKCVFNKRTIKVCVSCCWWCPRTSAPSLPHLTVSLYLCSSEATYASRLRALEGRRVNSKSPSRVRDRD